MSDLPFRPSFVFGSDSLALVLPLLPWAERSGGVGGHAVSAAGVPGAYVLRTDRIVALSLRMLEEEVPDVLEVLEAIRNDAGSFTFRFDQDDPGTEFEVYLVSPVWPDEVAPVRDEGYLGAFNLDMEIRRVDGLPFDLSWTEVSYGS